MVKKTPPNNAGEAEMQVQFLSGEDPLEEEMATHSSILAWKIPWMESLVDYSPWGCKELDTTERLHFHFSLSCIGGGNGNPFQYPCLENPRDRGAWWAAVYGVRQSQTRLKRLSSSSSSCWISWASDHQIVTTTFV